jgi:hypothetical protein
MEPPVGDKYHVAAAVRRVRGSGWSANMLALRAAGRTPPGRMSGEARHEKIDMFRNKRIFF